MRCGSGLWVVADGSGVWACTVVALANPIAPPSRSSPSSCFIVRFIILPLYTLLLSVSFTDGRGVSLQINLIAQAYAALLPIRFPKDPTN